MMIAQKLKELQSEYIKHNYAEHEQILYFAIEIANNEESKYRFCPYCGESLEQGENHKC